MKWKNHQSWWNLDVLWLDLDRIAIISYQISLNTDKKCWENGKLELIWVESYPFQRRELYKGNLIGIDKLNELIVLCRNSWKINDKKHVHEIFIQIIFAMYDKSSCFRFITVFHHAFDHDEHQWDLYPV